MHSFLRLAGLLLICSATVLLGISDSERRDTLRAIISHDEVLIPIGLLQEIRAQQIRLDEFDKSLSKLNLKKAIQTVRAAEEYVMKPVTYALRPEHRDKNTHIGCAPYDATRALRHLQGFYISASDVFTPEQAYIIGESPSNRTEDDFWRAIIEAHVDLIVALVTPEGDCYWNSTHFPKTVHGYKICLTSENELCHSGLYESHQIIQRCFSIQKSGHTNSQTVTHLQYKNWPDHGSPEGNLFHTFLELTEKIHTDSTKTIFVHCAAGIGRSGTFVAAHSLRADVRKLVRRRGPHFINIFQRILELRMQRSRMLKQTTQIAIAINAVRDAVYIDYLTQALHK